MNTDGSNKEPNNLEPVTIAEHLLLYYMSVCVCLTCYTTVTCCIQNINKKCNKHCARLKYVHTFNTFSVI